MARADVVLPAVASTELDGTFTNLEGRVSVVARKVTSPGTSRPDWAIAAELAERLGTDLGFTSVDDVLAELREVSTVHAGITPEALAETTREGLLVEGLLVTDRPAPTSVPGRDGYGLRLVVDRSMYDSGVLVSHSPSLASLAPGTRAGLEPTDLARHGIADGEVVDLISARSTIQVVVVADAGVARGTVHIRANQPDVVATALLDATVPVTEVRVGRR